VRTLIVVGERVRGALVRVLMRTLVLGVWEAADHRIVIRRDQLNDLARYAGTLLHEIDHVISRTSDGTLDFENELSRLLGMTASATLKQRGYTR
jgi:hypothetical protein